MPFYRWHVPKDSLSLQQRQDVAKAFTDVHCDSTGAPRSFVHVAFFEDGDADHPTAYYMDGGNRAGRPPEVREKLLGDLLHAFTEITGVPPDQVDGRITEGPASWTMEGGAILPEPGQEGPEWYRHAPAEAAS